MGVVADSAIVVKHKETQSANQPKFYVPETHNVTNSTFEAEAKQYAQTTPSSSHDGTVPELTKHDENSAAQNNRAATVVGKIMDAITGNGKIHSGTIAQIYETGFPACEKAYSQWIKSGFAKYMLPNGEAASGNLLKDLKIVAPELSGLIDQFQAKNLDSIRKPEEEKPKVHAWKRPKPAIPEVISLEKGKDIANKIQEQGRDHENIVKILSKLSPEDRKIVAGQYEKKYGTTLEERFEKVIKEPVDRLKVITALSEFNSDIAVEAIHKAVSPSTMWIFRGTDEDALSEVFELIPSKKGQEVLSAYEEKYGESVEDALRGDVDANTADRYLEKIFGFDAERIANNLKDASGTFNDDEERILFNLSGVGPVGRTPEQLAQIAEHLPDKSIESYLESVFKKDSDDYAAAMGYIAGTKEGYYSARIYQARESANDMASIMRELKPNELEGFEETFNSLYAEKVGARNLRAYLNNTFSGSNSKSLFDALDRPTMDIGPLPVGNWSNELIAAATLTGLTGRYLEAVMLGESSGDRSARGSSGEISLMQIMPETGQGLGYSAADLWIPSLNIECGAKYLAEIRSGVLSTANALKLELEESELLKLMYCGYNAGSDNAVLAVQYRTQGFDVDESIELACKGLRTPANVRRIMDIYRQLQDDQTIPDSSIVSQ